MCILFPEKIVAEASTIDNMLCLFRDVGLVWLQVELISSPTELVRGVILQADSAELCRPVIASEPERVHVQFP